MAGFQTGLPGPFAGQDLPWLLAARARLRPQHPFLVWAPFEGPAETWTYARFHDAVGRLAAGLARRGIGAGDPVLVHLENAPELLLAYFALAELGAIAVLTNTRAAQDEIAYFASHSRCVAAITQPSFAAVVNRAAPALRWIAVTAHDAGTPAAAPLGDSFASLFAETAADRPRRAPDPAAAALGALHLGHHLAPQGRGLDACERTLGGAGERGARGPAADRRAPDLPAALPRQCAGLLAAGDALGRGRRRCCSRNGPPAASGRSPRRTAPPGSPSSGSRSAPFSNRRSPATTACA